MRRILTIAAATALLGTVATPAAAEPRSPGSVPSNIGVSQGFATGDDTPEAPVAALDEYGHRPHTPLQAVDSPGAPAPAPPGATPGSELPADWSLLGPPGGDVAAIAVSPADPELVLAGVAPSGGTGGTLYRSTDGGDSWSPVPALGGTSVLDIEFAPDGRVYLGTQSGVWTSADGGQDWTARDLGIGPNQFVPELALDPADPEVLWAGVGEALGQQPINLMRSVDGGQSWVNRTPPLPSPLAAEGIAVDPTDSDTVIVAFAGGFGGGSVWVTADGGDSWQNRSTGLPANPMTTVVYDGSRLLLGGGMLFGTQNLGLFASDDLGLSWRALHDDSWPVQVVTDIAVDPAQPGTILAATDGSGVHRSTDGGETWELGIGGSELLSARSLRFSPGDSAELFLGVNSLAVYRSTDGGDTFAASATGFTELTVTSIAANPLDGDEIAVGFEGQNSGGVISSTDGGETWTVQTAPPTRYNAVGFAPDGTLHALSDGPSSVAPEGLYRRAEDGSWQALGPDQGPLFESRLVTMRFSADDPELIMLGGEDFGVAGNEATIWRSADDGQNWTKVYEEGQNVGVLDLEIIEDGTDQHQLAVWDSRSGDNIGGVLSSRDGGRSWEPSEAGLPGGFFRQSRICASPSHPETLYLSAWRSFDSGAVFRTDDGGASWQSTGWIGDRINDIACDPVDDQVLYISKAGAEPVARSADQAATFAPFANGLAAVNLPGSLAFAEASRLLLSTRQGSYATALREDDDPPDEPDPVVCDQTIIGMHVGPLTVSDGTTCLAAGAQVLGEVNVLAGAGLISTAAVVQGPVSAVGATVVDLSFSQVTGPVLVSAATHTVSLFGNQVTGSVTLLNNGTAERPIRAAGNTVIGSLSCFGNQPAPTDQGLPNTATGGKLGQCAEL